MIGASVDKPGSNERWARKYELKMPLISDYGDHTVSSAFGVARPMVGVAKRTTWLIDPDGTLRKIYPAVKAKGHAAQVSGRLQGDLGLKAERGGQGAAPCPPLSLRVYSSAGSSRGPK